MYGEYRKYGMKGKSNFECGDASPSETFQKLLSKVATEMIICVIEDTLYFSSIHSNSLLQSISGVFHDCNI